MLIRSVLPAICLLVGAQFLFDGLRTAWHGVPGVCDKHSHTAFELGIFFAIGMAVVAVGTAILWLSWRLWSKPSVFSIYLAGLCALFGAMSIAPQLPCLTHDTSNCLWAVALWSLYWLVCPRLPRIYEIETSHDPTRRLHRGIIVFSLSAWLLFLPTDNLEHMLLGQGRLLNLAFLCGAFALTWWLVKSMLRWHRRGMPAYDVLKVAGVAGAVMLASDLVFQKWWPNPLEPLVIQEGQAVPQRSRQTIVRWPDFDRWLVVWDDGQGRQEINKAVGPSKATVHGVYQAVNDETLSWSTSVNGDGSHVVVFGDQVFDLSQGSTVFLKTRKDGEIDVESVSHSDAIDRNYRWYEDADGSFMYYDRRRVLERGCEEWIGYISFYFTLESWSNSPFSGSPGGLKPSVRIVDKTDGMHRIKREVDETAVVFRGLVDHEIGADSSWSIRAERQGNTKFLSPVTVVIDNKSYALDQGEGFQISRNGDQLSVTQEPLTDGHQWRYLGVTSGKR